MPISPGHSQFINLNIGVAFCEVGLRELEVFENANPKSFDQDSVAKTCVSLFDISQGLELIFRSILLASGVSIKFKGNHPIKDMYTEISERYPNLSDNMTKIGISDNSVAELLTTLQRGHANARYFGLGNGRKKLNFAGLKYVRQFYLLVGFTFLTGIPMFRRINAQYFDGSDHS